MSSLTDGFYIDSLSIHGSIDFCIKYVFGWLVGWLVVLGLTAL